MTDPHNSQLRPYEKNLGGGLEEYAESDEQPASRGAAWLRPYQLTRGRTVPADPTLALEAQVVANPTTLDSAKSFSLEYRDVLGAARTPVSVAELGALLHLHLQVVRVLVGDLAAEGHLRILRPSTNVATDPAMIERVIRGLSRIA